MPDSRAILHITMKELRDHFFGPSAYIFIIVFLALSFWLFLSDFFVRGQANLRLFFDWAPILLLIFIPAVAMGKWADEKKQGTMESLFTLPLRAVEVVLGKFAASFLFLVAILFFTLPLAVVVGFLGEPDWGMVSAGYLGLALLSASYLAISLFISSLTPNAIVVFILSFVTLFVFYLIGEPVFLSYAPDFFVPLLTQVGLGHHFESIGRGLIDSRDLLYYASVVGFFLFLNALSVSSRKERLRVSSLVGAILFAVNLLSYSHFFRIDLTAEKEYTLSDSTKKILSGLDDRITLKLYFTKKIPPHLTPHVQSALDFLEEYQVYGGGKISVERVVPEESARLEQETEMMGIPPLQLNVKEKDKLEVRKVYLGLAVLFGDKKEILPVVADIRHLEYDLSLAILKLTSSTTPRIGIVYASEDGGVAEEFKTVEEIVGDQIEFRKFGLRSKNLSAEELTALLVVAPEKAPKEFVDELDAVFEASIPVILLAGRVDVGQNLFAHPYETGLEEWLAGKGLKLNPALVIEPKFPGRASFSTGYVQYNIPYPFFVRVPREGLNNSHPITAQLEEVLFPWTNSIDIMRETHPEWSYTTLAESSEASFLQEGEPVIDPQMLEGQEIGVGQKRPVALVLEAPTDRGTTRKLYVVANTQFAKGSLLNDSPANILFLQNMIDGVSRGEALIGIRSRGKTDRPIGALEPLVISTIRLALLVGIPLLVIALGFAIAFVRKRRILSVTRNLFLPLPLEE